MFIIKGVLKFLSLIFIFVLLIGPTTCKAGVIIGESTVGTTKTSKFHTNQLLSFKGKTTYTTPETVVNVKKEEVKPIVYNPDNLREISNLTEEQISKILEGSNLEVLAKEYSEMEEKYGINALFLIALNIEESGWGRSSLAQNNNNLGGVTSRYGGYASFDSWEQCLDYISNLINSEYLTESGSYYYGTSIYDVNVKYCTGSQWSSNLNTIAYQLLDKAQGL